MIPTKTNVSGTYKPTEIAAKAAGKHVKSRTIKKISHT